MSFFNQLAKGFIQSGVNQLGGDGGKGVSNQVYGIATPPQSGVQDLNRP